MTVEETRTNAEAEIKRVIEDGVEAIRDKNIEGVMALYLEVKQQRRNSLGVRACIHDI